VSKTSVDDVRDFSAKFREPSLIVYRAIEESTISNKGKVKLEANLDIKVPIDVLRTKSLSSHSRPTPMVVPNHRDLIAFDAEFVSVADEESVLTMSGSKVVVRETRHAVARISLILNGNKLVADDHIMPRERVTDYLTRFSGIESDDLNPKRSSRHLIGQSAGYLKLRALIERGCIFVGHGLQQDFWTANLAVPAHQIIDTVDIYHKVRIATTLDTGFTRQFNVPDSELLIASATVRFASVLDQLCVEA
jgi:PAB-dependent poly(A)-specific ribonuclease subunit 2